MAGVSAIAMTSGMSGMMPGSYTEAAHSRQVSAVVNTGQRDDQGN